MNLQSAFTKMKDINTFKLVNMDFEYGIRLNSKFSKKIELRLRISHLNVQTHVCLRFTFRHSYETKMSFFRTINNHLYKDFPVRV